MVIASRPTLICLLAALVAAMLLSTGAAAAPPPGWTAAALAERPEAASRSIARERGQGGAGAMDPLAGALVAAAPGNDVAGPLWTLAAQASPDSTYLPAQRLRRALAAHSPAAAGRAFVVLIGSALADPWWQLTVLAVCGVVLCGAAWFLAGALVLYHGVARGRLLLHDYADSFPARFRRVTPLAFGVFVLSAFWAAGIGPLVVLVMVGLVLVPYMNRRARLAFGLAVGIGCLLPMAATELGAWIGPGADAAWTTYRVQRGDGGQNLLAAIQAQPATARGHYLAARVARRNGDLAAAEQFLVLAGDGLEPGVVANERGNLAFLRGDLERAAVLYGAATAARPKDPVPWLNRHLVDINHLDLEAADAALARARGLDAGLAARFEEERTADPTVLSPVSQPVPRGWVWAAFVAGRGAAPLWSQTAGALFLPGTVIRPGVVGVFALLFAVLAGHAGRERRSRLCPSCGFVVCPRCSRRVKGSLLCAACWNAANDRDVDTSELQRRAQRAANWARWQTRGGRLGHLLLPGWGDYLGAAPWRGAGVVLLWAGGAGWAVTAWVFPLPLFAWGGVHLHWAAGLVPLGLAHAVGVWRALGRGEEGR